MELFGSDIKFVSESLWCTAPENWAPKVTIKNGPEGDGRLQSLVFCCFTPEGIQKTLYCHQKSPNLSDTPHNEGLNCKTIFLGEVKLKSGSEGFEAQFIGTRHCKVEFN